MAGTRVLSHSVTSELGQSRPPRVTSHKSPSSGEERRHTVRAGLGGGWEYLEMYFFCIYFSFI